MKTLKFIVDNHVIKPDPNCPDFEGLVPGGGNVKLVFSFSNEWRGYFRVVAFYSTMGNEYDPQILEDGTHCMVPAEALTKRVFKVRVFGRNGDSESIKTNKFAVHQNGGAV